MQTYFREIKILLQNVIKMEGESIDKASKIIMESIRSGGILQLFGCGHSHLLAQDAYYRAGGLVPVRPITMEPLMLHKGAFTSSRNEKDSDFIKRHAADFDFKKNDILIVISTSGLNPVPIDVALLAKKKDVFVMSLQSLEYREQKTRHESGQRLEDVVDLVLNTHIPVGDGLLNRHGIQYGPASTVVGSAVLNAMFSQVIEALSDEMDILPVFKSNNVSTNLSHNVAMIAKYNRRINFE